jgi:hypothetical protein
MPLEEPENLGGIGATFRFVHPARDGEGASAAGHGTAAGEQAPRWESPTAIDGQRPRPAKSARVRPWSPGSADLAVGEGERGRGPRTTTRARRGAEAWLSIERTRGGRASGAPVNCAPDRRGFAVSFEETGPCQGRGERRAGRAAHTAWVNAHDDRLPAKQVVTRAFLIDVSASMELLSCTPKTWGAGGRDAGLL